MKKIFVLLVLFLFSGACGFAQEKSRSAGSIIRNVFQKKAIQEQVEKSNDDDLTPSQQANLFYSDNDVKKSFDILLRIPEAKRTAQDWLLLGNILQDQEKISDATFMYQRALLVNPKYYKAFYNLGNIYLADEKPFLAIENYRKANKANNEFAYAYYNLGCAYIQTGMLKKAKIAFLKSIELKKTEPDFYYNLAYVYKQLNKPKLGKQYLDFYNKVLETSAN